MTLKTFVEASMPEDATGIFGSGTAGEVWKSMLAEQIANQMARAGGIGIAAQLAKFETQATPATPAPVGPTSAADSPLDPKLLSMTVERRIIDRLSPADGLTSAKATG